jgi:hypothetical protein
MNKKNNSVKNNAGSVSILFHHFNRQTAEGVKLSQNNYNKYKIIIFMDEQQLTER